VADVSAYSQFKRSERLDNGPFYTLINRTTRRLTVTVDGRQWDLEPGENRNIPSAVAQYAQKQHPRLGTFDESGLFGESLIAVKGVTPADQATMIPPGREHLGDELIDRVKHPHKKPTSFESLPARRRLIEHDPTLDAALATTEATGRE
jgi:hypothetical protein